MLVQNVLIIPVTHLVKVKNVHMYTRHKHPQISTGWGPNNAQEWEKSEAEHHVNLQTKDQRLSRQEASVFNASMSTESLKDTQAPDHNTKYVTIQALEGVEGTTEPWKYAQIM